MISNLVKQNFDLKLEIHHRRERQEKLESRLDALETNKQQMEEVNDKLLEELEKRDKAVEEAVAMIVMLEAKVDQLVEERTLAQEIEANDSLSHDAAREKSSSTPKPRRGSNSDLASKTINRMPSFVSEQNETTENLRYVYLNALGSILSLSRVPEAHPEADNVPSSPTLSVLSESSFLSVYGQRGADKTAPAKAGDVVSYDGNGGVSGATSTKELDVPLRDRAGSRQVSRGSSATNVSNIQPEALERMSPLQQIERLNQDYTDKREDRQGQSPAKTMQSSRLLPGKSPSRARTKEEKRQALRKVITDAPGGVRLIDHGLPPTPDTMSSSTLHRFKYSDDSLSQRHGISKDITGGVFSEAAAMVQDLRTLPEVTLAPSLQASQPHPAKDLSRYYGHAAFFDARNAPIQRPHSASETTVSRRRGNDWGSDSDDTDARSVESSLDVWMQESAKPDRHGGRVSPDLFGFPTTGRTWATEAMFSRDSPRVGGARVDFDNDQMHDLFSIQNALFASAAPPAPNRRSSLHARTASSSGIGPVSGYPPAQPKPQRSPDRAASHNRRNSDLTHLREDTSTPTQAQFPPPPAPSSEHKRHRYPPVSGQLGARMGLNKIFRRSVSGAPPNFVLEPNPTPAPAHSAPIEDVSKGGVSVGVPSRVNHGPVLDDDFSSATPPPIMRNPRHARTGSLGLDNAFSSAAHLVEAARPKTPSIAAAMASTAARHQQAPQQVDEAAPSNTTAAGSRRKWLSGFGRSSSMKNRAG